MHKSYDNSKFMYKYTSKYEGKFEINKIYLRNFNILTYCCVSYL